MSRIRILIVDDQPVVCEGLNCILQLEKDFEVIGVCHNGQEALEFCEGNRPDIVLMDARMPVINGIVATREMHRRNPEAKVLMLTTFNDENLIFESIQNGVKGFLLKDLQPDELCRCIRSVYAGGACLDPEVTLKVMEKLMSPGNGSPSADWPEIDIDQLTNREKEVLNLISRGLSNAEIASELFIVKGTVKNHVSNLLAKLGLRDRTQLAIRVQKNGT